MKPAVPARNQRSELAINPRISNLTVQNDFNTEQESISNTNNECRRSSYRRTNNESIL